MYNIIEILGLIGLSNIIINGIITKKLRAWLYTKNEIVGSLLECAICVGFWTGFLYSLFFKSKMDICVNDILFGGMISILAFIIDIIIENIEVKNGLLRGQNQTENDSD